LSVFFCLLSLPPSRPPSFLSYRHEVGALADIVHRAGAIEPILREHPTPILNLRLGERDVRELGNFADEDVGGLGDVDGEGEGFLLVGVVLRGGREGGREGE